MDRLDAMSILLTVIEEGSLSAGSRKLRLPLTTVSRRISDLERHLGTRLLNRTSRRIDLTPTGQTYVAASKRILEQVLEAERAAAGEYSTPRGELFVTAPIVFGRRHIVPLATAFLAAHPEIDIRLFLIDRSVNLVEDHVDIALRIGPLADSALLATRLGSVRRVVCASPDYLARRGVPTTPQALSGHEAVTFQGFPATPEWRFQDGAKTITVPVRARLAVNTAEAAVDAALAGLGITRVLSYQVAPEIRSGALTLILEGYEPEPLPVSFVHPEQGPTPIKVRAFLDWSVPKLRAYLGTL
ncbi:MULTISPECIES: LysR family transcriptional regulator [Methylobacterium]|uniref:HTH-type transcriptional regulator PgrR n=1 Tax=Methylobacterium thuringiense TaxID=1003091 RepID=A0ABQ4TK57_9HYPH|nr:MULTISPECIES: LysR family transcriptional regulator [Methylobacterium]TXN23943.1 LysR family transcriptional regulator [Methylobacterium sp. WL9]GJE55209.1 HTH-type transcriptional regulator PgrR [Methylobacterium thuringiense]